MTEDRKEENIDIEYAFSIIRDKNGNLGIKPMIQGTKVLQAQIYDACHAICRNIQAQEIAEQVGLELVKAATAAQGKGSSKLVLPSDIARSL